jgi:two-component system, cell cycle response regulator
MQVSKGGKVQGTILILDGVATNRIMLKVQLSAAYYHVVQAEGLAGLCTLLHRTRPDLIVTAMTLPDGTALALRAMLRDDDALAGIPVIAITAQNDHNARLAALAGGIDDVLHQPLDDLILQARIRSLIRARNSTEELRPRDGSPGAMGFAEPEAGFATPRAAPVAARVQVALVARRPATATLWCARLRPHTAYPLKAYRMDDIQQLMTSPAPQIFVVELTPEAAGPGLRLLADLRARNATRRAAIIAVCEPGHAALCADALDRGAHDVMMGGFCPEELALRLAAQLRHKTRSDLLRDSVRDGLRAAVLDPMTGLYNRRYALPRLARIAGHAARTGTSFAVMLLDLDHFKQINDHFGHPAGDAVLTETARRLRSQLTPDDMIARVGGEEFLIVMPGADRTRAKLAADRLCRRINSQPFVASGLERPIHVTTSIGVAVGPHPGCGDSDDDGQSAAALIGQADRALYAAKGGGRNQVTLARLTA